MIIDGHCHVGGPPERRGSPPDMLEVMDRLGIDAAFAMPPPGLRPDNDALADLIRPYPDRFLGMAWVNPYLEVLALKDLECAATLHGFKGVKLQPSLHAFSVMQPLVRPVVDLAAQLGLVVVVHTGDAPFGLPWEVGELASRYPSTTFIMSHMGLSVMTYVEAAIRIAQQVPNIILDCSTVGFFRKIRDAVEAVGPERVVWGSDAPIVHPGPELLKVKEAGLTAAEEQLVLGGNLVRLLDLRASVWLKVVGNGSGP
jgi:predicted TIM-barrel fold metal-dependent hydrolase